MISTQRIETLLLNIIMNFFYNDMSIIQYVHFGNDMSTAQDNETLKK